MVAEKKEKVVFWKTSPTVVVGLQSGKEQTNKSERAELDEHTDSWQADKQTGRQYDGRREKERIVEDK